MHPTLTIAVKAAPRAGNFIQRSARDLDLLTITTKGPKDFVSEVDRTAEATIVETILEAYPDHAILAEEGTAKGANADCSNLTVSGYPLRFVVTCDALAYQDDSRNVAAASGGVVAAASLLRPLVPNAELDGPLRTSVPGMLPLWIDWDSLQASTIFGGRCRARLSVSDRSRRNTGCVR